MINILNVMGQFKWTCRSIDSGLCSIILYQLWGFFVVLFCSSLSFFKCIFVFLPHLRGLTLNVSALWFCSVIFGLWIWIGCISIYSCVSAIFQYKQLFVTQVQYEKFYVCFYRSFLFVCFSRHERSIALW